MITAKIGEKIVNCFDGEHSRETLKTWADKGILKCPACGKEYEYCHGRVVRPYFRHKEKTDCVDKYSEPETNEHIQGKIALYNWIKEQNGISDVILEAWIPETRQRPDIAFKYNGKQYVFEFQCTPISTVYLERHELYQAAGITDIWILGTEKYFKRYSRGKYIENFAIGHYNVEKNYFSDIKAIDKNQMPYGLLDVSVLREKEFNELVFDGKISVSKTVLEKYVEEDTALYVKKCKRDKIKSRVEEIYNKCKGLSKQYLILPYPHFVEVTRKNMRSTGDYCRVLLEFNCNYSGCIIFRIFDNKVCIYRFNNDDEEYMAGSFEYKDLNEMYSKITSYIGDRIRENMYKIRRVDING